MLFAVTSRQLFTTGFLAFHFLLMVCYSF
uniref:Uncharacterized protein n=1 Tax=Arundo donax TaxID=35708 RepID=A0A0A9DZS1_ARUDO